MCVCVCVRALVYIIVDWLDDLLIISCGRAIEGTTALEALEKGLDDLMDLCDVVVDRFTAAREEYANSRA